MRPMAVINDSTDINCNKPSMMNYIAGTFDLMTFQDKVQREYQNVSHCRNYN